MFDYNLDPVKSIELFVSIIQLTEAIYRFFNNDKKNVLHSKIIFLENADLKNGSFFMPKILFHSTLTP